MPFKSTWPIALLSKPLNCLTRYDVLTTGATAAGCAKALLRGGAKAVDVLTPARVVRAVE